MNQEQRDTIERLKQHAQRRIWVTFQDAQSGLRSLKMVKTEPLSSMKLTAPHFLSISKGK